MGLLAIRRLGRLVWIAEGCLTLSFPDTYGHPQASNRQASGLGVPSVTLPAKQKESW